MDGLGGTIRATILEDSSVAASEIVEDDFEEDEYCQPTAGRQSEDKEEKQANVARRSEKERRRLKNKEEGRRNMIKS